ncbi:MAG: hypothetical protein LM558_00010 [Thermosphaera sp.]|nr:hypothetical protein [Thermosphaera sp.]
MVGIKLIVKHYPLVSKLRISDYGLEYERPWSFNVKLIDHVYDEEAESFLNSFVTEKLKDYLDISNITNMRNIGLIRFDGLEIPVSKEEIKQLINTIITRKYRVKLRESNVRKLFGDELAEKVKRHNMEISGRKREKLASRRRQVV